MALYLSLSGCSLLKTNDEPIKRKSKKLLSTFFEAEKQVDLDVYFVHVEQSEESKISEIWNDLDEQQIDNELRGRLLKSGFRIGVSATQLPDALVQLIAQGKQTAPDADVAQAGGLWKAQTYQQKLQMQPNQHSEITTSTVLPEVAVISSTKSDISGKSFYNVKGVFSVQADPQGDGRVKLKLLPELHHGESRQRYVGNNGVLWANFGQDKEIFDDLTIHSTLAPGQLLVIGVDEDRQGLGKHFLTYTKAGKKYQKFLVIRYIDSKYDDATSHTIEVPQPLDLSGVEQAVP